MYLNSTGTILMTLVISTCTTSDDKSTSTIHGVIYLNSTGTILTTLVISDSTTVRW